MSLLKDFTKGIWKENPVLVLLLGTCPTLAVTSSATNGVGMGIATTFVLAGSNLVISLISGIVPKKIRIPVYIVVIATFVTIIDLLMKAYAPPTLYAALGIFIPLIVVNCIVLGRAEAFASKNGPLRSILDGVGMVHADADHARRDPGVSQHRLDLRGEDHHGVDDRLPAAVGGARGIHHRRHDSGAAQLLLAAEGDPGRTALCAAAGDGLQALPDLHPGGGRGLNFRG